MSLKIHNNVKKQAKKRSDMMLSKSQIETITFTPTIKINKLPTSNSLTNPFLKQTQKEGHQFSTSIEDIYETCNATHIRTTINVYRIRSCFTKWPNFTQF